MSRSISIAGWQEGFSSPQGVAVIFDIFRCSTTVHTLMGRRKGPVWVAPSIAKVSEQTNVKEWAVFSELSQPTPCLERFDNSPHQASEYPWKSNERTVVATTTGTPALFAAKGFSDVLVGSLVGFSALIKHLDSVDGPITLIPAAIRKDQVEDGIVAQAVATALDGYSSIADFVTQCGQRAIEEIVSSGRPRILEDRLPTGKADMRHCLWQDRDPFVLRLQFEETSGLAKVHFLEQRN
jgi:phosphosulfolactate phosphohydrolase-like enzyme